MLSYPKVYASVDGDSIAELQEDYDMSDPDRSKIKPLKSARERYEFFAKVVANETKETSLCVIQNY